MRTKLANMLSRLWPSLCLVLAASLATSASGQWPAARLYARFPAGGQAGTSVDLALTAGDDLEEVSELRFTHPGISAVAKPEANAFTVSIGADVPAGDYEVRALGAHGLTNPRVFVVGTSAETTEIDPNDLPEAAQAVEVETIVNGLANPARDVDCFRVAVKANQTYVVECRAAGIDSRLSPYVEVWSEGGRRLASGWQPRQEDLYLPVRSTRDESWIVRVCDFEYAGGADRPYRLRVSTSPCVRYAFPPALAAGTTTRVELFGWNLPGGQAVLGSEPLETLALEVAAPPEDAWSASAPLRKPIEAGIPTFSWSAPWPVPSLRGVQFSRADTPPLAEQAANDTAEGAQNLAWPCEVAGRFDRAGDVDWYSFAKAEGEVVWIEVFAERCGSSADAALRVERVVTTPQGKSEVKVVHQGDDDAASPAGRDFATRSIDPRVRVDGPGGAYRVAIGNLRRNSGGGFVETGPAIYRLTLRRESPDFALVAMSEFPITPETRFDLWSVLVRRGGTEKLKVAALRRDGFAGAIDLAVAGLPAGVTASPATIGPGQDAAYIILEATPEAAEWAGAVRIVGRAKVGETAIERAALAGTAVWPGAERAPATSRTTSEIALAVGDDSGYRVAPASAAIRTYPQQRWPIELQLERREGFAGAVELAPIHLPPGAACDGVTVAADAKSATAQLRIDSRAPAGRWTFHFLASAAMPKLDPPPDQPKKRRGRKQDRKVAEPSLPLQVEVLPALVIVEPTVPSEGAVKRGESLTIPVKLSRANGFSGPVRLRLSTPAPVAGLASETVEIAADKVEGAVTIACGADAPAGPQPMAAIAAEFEWQGEQVRLEQPIALVIQ